MKKIILFLLLSIVCAGVQAQNAMVLKMKDGTRNVVYLRAPSTSPTMIPYVTFEDGDIVVRGDHELRVSMADVQHYIYTETPDGIETMGAATPIVKFRAGSISRRALPEIKSTV